MERIDQIVNEMAEAAFAALGQCVPEAEYGDVDPLTLAAFEEALHQFVRAWLTNNAPDVLTQQAS